MSAPQRFLCGGTPTPGDLAAVETFELFLEDVGARDDGDLDGRTWWARWEAWATGRASAPTAGPWPWEADL